MLYRFYASLVLTGVVVLQLVANLLKTSLCPEVNANNLNFKSGDKERGNLFFQDIGGKPQYLHFYSTTIVTTTRSERSFKLFRHSLFDRP